ncbi:hypothetical protein [Helicobacter rodentium]|uniref:hypothetical protein n=1 Tax=Helicobacter rodentium TaxID=59617 RepID=UPI002354E9A7|nr:hypothetical protein [Helicobacter rodentium]
MSRANNEAIHNLNCNDKVAEFSNKQFISPSLYVRYSITIKQKLCRIAQKFHS